MLTAHLSYFQQLNLLRVAATNMALFCLFRSGLAINPAKSWASLGNVYKTDGQLDMAERAYKQALVHRPSMSDTHYNL